MGEGTRSVENPRTPEPERLEHEVDAVRDNIDHIVSELDRRRHDALDWRLQLRKHAVMLGLVAMGLAAAIGATIGLSIWRSRRRAGPMSKARRLRQALSRAIEHPEWVARPSPSVGKKALFSAASAFAGAAAKATARRLVGGGVRMTPIEDTGAAR